VYPGGAPEGARAAPTPGRVFEQLAAAQPDRSPDTDPTVDIAYITARPHQLQPPPARFGNHDRPPTTRPPSDIVPRPVRPVVSDPQIRRAHPCRCPCGHLPTMPPASPGEVHHHPVGRAGGALGRIVDTIVRGPATPLDGEALPVIPPPPLTTPSRADSPARPVK
jgi:hypothetical protein